MMGLADYVQTQTEEYQYEQSANISIDENVSWEARATAHNSIMIQHVAEQAKLRRDRQRYRAGSRSGDPVKQVDSFLDRFFEDDKDHLLGDRDADNLTQNYGRLNIDPVMFVPRRRPSQIWRQSQASATVESVNIEQKIADIEQQKTSTEKRLEIEEKTARKQCKAKAKKLKLAGQELKKLYTQLGTMNEQVRQSREIVSKMQSEKSRYQVEVHAKTHAIENEWQKKIESLDARFRALQIENTRFERQRDTAVQKSHQLEQQTQHKQNMKHDKT